MLPKNRPVRPELPYPLGEITAMYRQSANKNRQIDILADMCDTRPAFIAYLLREAGYPVPCVKLPRVLDKNEPAPWAMWQEFPVVREAKEHRKLVETLAAEAKNSEPEVALPVGKSENMEEEIMHIEANETVPETPVTEKAEPDMTCPAGESPVGFDELTDRYIAALWDTYFQMRGIISLHKDDVRYMMKLAELASAMAREDTK